MFENPRRGRQARKFTNVSTDILDLRSSSEQIFPKIDVGYPCIPSRSICQILAIFFWSWILNDCMSSGKEKQSGCLWFTSSTMGEDRQWRQRNVQKSVMHVQSCCFANLNLLLFCRSGWRHRRRCLSSLWGDGTPGNTLLKFSPKIAVL